MFGITFNKPAVIRNMTARQGFDSKIQELLSLLSNKELRIVAKHQDLQDRVVAISKMTPEELGDTLEKDFQLEVDQWPREEIWIHPRKLQTQIPDWFTSQHVGWEFSSQNDDLPKWARTFLMQEVKINIWIRYIEYKKKEAKNERLNNYYDCGYL